ncbi:MAG TPA: hypothetical protein VEM96_08870 [Pyrinomonadaceae bacterium]|nr:hypothetical protein [Pyrinomonadaceae bacterium]
MGQLQELLGAQRDWMALPVRVGSLREPESVGQLLLGEPRLFRKPKPIPELGDP